MKLDWLLVHGKGIKMFWGQSGIFGGSRELLLFFLGMIIEVI